MSRCANEPHHLADGTPKSRGNAFEAVEQYHQHKADMAAGRIHPQRAAGDGFNPGTDGAQRGFQRTAGTLFGLSIRADRQIVINPRGSHTPRLSEVEAATARAALGAGANAAQHRWAAGLMPVTDQPRHTGAYTRAVAGTDNQQEKS